MKPMEKTVKGQRKNTVSEDDNKIDNLSAVEKHEIAKRFDGRKFAIESAVSTGNEAG